MFLTNFWFKHMTHIVGDNTGWLIVKLEPSGDRIALPEYLKVELTKTENARDYITILEGVHRGKNASVKASNLGSMATYKGAAKLVFDIAKEELNYGGSQTLKAITDPSNPIPKGIHNIQIPDFPHPSGRSYLSQTVHALSWFYMGVGNAIAGKNDRYLHTGSVSAGCVTVSPSDWDKLYEHVILSRQGDDTNVGTIKVV